MDTNLSNDESAFLSAAALLLASSAMHRKDLKSYFIAHNTRRHDAHIGIGDFAEALAQTGLSLTEQEIGSLMKVFGSGLDGRIDYSAFCRSVERLEQIDSQTKSALRSEQDVTAVLSYALHQHRSPAPQPISTLYSREQQAPTYTGLSLPQYSLVRVRETVSRYKSPADAFATYQRISTGPFLTVSELLAGLRLDGMTVTLSALLDALALVLPRALDATSTLTLEEVCRVLAPQSEATLAYAPAQTYRPAVSTASGIPVAVQYRSRPAAQPQQPPSARRGSVSSTKSGASAGYVPADVQPATTTATAYDPYRYAPAPPGRSGSPWGAPVSAPPPPPCLAASSPLLHAAGPPAAGRVPYTSTGQPQQPISLVTPPLARVAAAVERLTSRVAAGRNDDRSAGLAFGPDPIAPRAGLPSTATADADRYARHYRARASDPELTLARARDAWRRLAGLARGTTPAGAPAHGVNAEDLRVGAGQAGVLLTPEETAGVVYRYDADGDGVLDLQEWVAMLNDAGGC